MRLEGHTETSLTIDLNTARLRWSTGGGEPSPALGAGVLVTEIRGQKTDNESIFRAAELLPSLTSPDSTCLNRAAGTAAAGTRILRDALSPGARATRSSCWLGLS